MSLKRVISLFDIPLTDASRRMSAFHSYRCSGPVEIPLADPETAAFFRWQMRNWCEEFCEAEWGLAWLQGGEVAAFHYAAEKDAVLFKLRFSELLER